jgi:hypothetical protein
MLREEIALLQEMGSHIGEVVKQMGKDKVLVKVSSTRRVADSFFFLGCLPSLFLLICGAPMSPFPSMVCVC